jgi:hypothetical protein
MKKSKDNLTNKKLYQIKTKYRLTVNDLVDLLSGSYGGPSWYTVSAWCQKENSANFNPMPAMALYLLEYRLKEYGYD